MRRTCGKMIMSRVVCKQYKQQYRLVRYYIFSAHPSSFLHPFYHSLTYFDKGRNQSKSLSIYIHTLLCLYYSYSTLLYIYSTLCLLR
jgi:hypothetical protein